MKKFYLPIAALALMAAGCAPESITWEASSEGRQPMMFTAGNITLGAATRATTDNDWEGVSTVAVQVGDEVKEYTVTSESPYTTATLSSEDPFYWSSSGQTVTVSAWYPYAAQLQEVMVKADQSTEDAYQASDYIAVEGQQVQYGGNNSLTFSHRTAKVVINIEANYGKPSDEELAAATVSIGGVSGVEGGGSTVTAYHNGGTQYIALLAPQDIAAGRQFISLEAGGEVYAYTPDNDVTLKGGYAYTYNITIVGEGKVEVSNVTVSSWTENEEDIPLETE